MKIALGLCALIVISFAGCGTQPSAPPVTAAAVVPAGEPLPPSEETAKARLEKSPRHGEYVDVPLPSGGVPIRTWVVYPERKDRAGVVLVIHEVYGLSDWLRGVADQLAQEGFIAVAPDLISGLGPGGGGTDSVATRDDVVKLVRSVTPADANARLDAVRAWAVALPSSNGRSATIGFCWGGARSFAYAAAHQERYADLTGITIDRIDSGQIVERWSETDVLGMMQQLGLVPPPSGH